MKIPEWGWIAIGFIVLWWWRTNTINIAGQFGRSDV